MEGFVASKIEKEVSERERERRREFWDGQRGSLPEKLIISLDA